MFLYWNGATFICHYKNLILYKNKKWAGSPLEPQTKPEPSGLGISGSRWILIFWNQEPWGWFLVLVQEPITLNSTTAHLQPWSTPQLQRLSRYPTRTNHEVRPTSTNSGHAMTVGDYPDRFKIKQWQLCIARKLVKSDHNQWWDISNLKRWLSVIAFSTVVWYPSRRICWLMFPILSVVVLIWNF